MNLDDTVAFRQLDSQGMLAQINGLPEQLERAYELGSAFPLPECSDIEHILVTGMGGAVAGPDLLAAWALDKLAQPVVIHQGYGLPAWARGKRTLVVAVSNSGETEETLSVFEQSVNAGCPVIAMTTGGRLADLAVERGVPAWVYPHQHAARSAVGWTFALFHRALNRMGWLPDPDEIMRDGLHAMRNAQMNLLADVPVVKNPAKRLAGQLVGRWVAVFTAGYLTPVARRWKTQLNEMAKTWAQFETIPEADHNTLEGFSNPERPLSSAIFIFLHASGLDARNLHRLDLTREFAMQQGINTDQVQARGNSRYAQLWTSLLFADYTAFFLAMAYGIDPTPTAALDYFRFTMSGLAEDTIEKSHRID